MIGHMTEQPPPPFRKAGSAAQNQWEAAGLAWLGAARGAQVVRVLAWNDRQLVEEFLSPVKPTAATAEAFGRDLARTHAAGAAGFGVGPDGWDDQQPGWIGRARLRLGRYQRWGEFYADLRVWPHAEAAHAEGHLSATGLDLVERLCQRLRAGEFDDDRPPARIHGDLWRGNVIPTTRGMIMIDPAAHGGHGLTDLAMLDLFGLPHLDRVHAAYAEAAQLPRNWQVDLRLHQLHPLLVHAELFGASYGAEVTGLAHSYA